jgi:DNA ligase-associated metallophosphoesterase
MTVTEPRRTRPPKRRPITLALESAGAGVRLKLAGEAALALPEGALWLEERGALIVSDLHFEKGSAFARRGQMLPPYDTRATLARLAALAAALKPRTIVSLGDSFHDGEGAARLCAEDAASLRVLTGACDWIWIEGNHDPVPPADLGGRAMSEIAFGALAFRHEAREGAPFEVSGHLHPCAKVAARGGAVRRRCFATDGARLVMPAFGAFTGGLNVCDEAFAPLFPNGCFALVMGKARLYPTAPERLAPD